MSVQEPNSREWLELSFHADPVAQEPLSAFLFDLGCTGIVMQDFEDECLRAYFPFDVDPETIQTRVGLFLQTLQDEFEGMPAPTWAWKRLPVQDWSLAWRRFFKPTRITDNLLILPAWETAPDGESGRVIRIDPGLAFGTGQHATTQMCLKAMETLPHQGAWPMLDLGTGSGILAIYGALLGAGLILALDTDPDALSWAARNLELNGLRDRVELGLRPVETLSAKFSLVVANLILGEILRLLPHFRDLLATGGRLILSGLLETQLARVDRSLKEQGILVEGTLLQEEWGCLVCHAAP